MPATLDEIRSDLERLERLVRGRTAPIPEDRLYTKKEAGFRIVHGVHPDSVPEGEEKERMWRSAMSETWVGDRLADDDCVLRKTALPGICRIEERSIRHFKKQRRLA